MCVIHQIVPWTVRNRARADHHRPAPLPSLNGVGRPSQQLRLRRSQAPALLYRGSDNASMRGDAILSHKNILLVSIDIVCPAVRHSHIWAAGGLNRRGRGRALASTPY
eukprot:5652934-Pyramimonas_sp.AAC.1